MIVLAEYLIGSYIVSKQPLCAIHGCPTEWKMAWLGEHKTQKEHKRGHPFFPIMGS